MGRNCPPADSAPGSTWNGVALNIHPPQVWFSVILGHFGGELRCCVSLDVVECRWVLLSVLGFFRWPPKTVTPLQLDQPILDLPEKGEKDERCDIRVPILSIGSPNKCRAHLLIPDFIASNIPMSSGRISVCIGSISADISLSWLRLKMTPNF